ncbi:ABC-three component system middle component 1 [Aeromonas media]
MKLSNKLQDFSYLATEFEGARFELYASDEAFLNCIVCWLQSANDLVNSWQAIQSIVSVKFKPEGRYAKWNIYLVLLCVDKLDVKEKYVIQNDRYAARKIVLDGLSVLPDSQAVEKMVNIELLGTDLELKVVSENTKEGADISIASLVKGAPSATTSAAKEERVAMINKLIEFLSNDENKKG